MEGAINMIFAGFVLGYIPPAKPAIVLTVPRISVRLQAEPGKSETNFILVERAEAGFPKIILIADLGAEERVGNKYLSLCKLPYRGRPSGLPEEQELSQAIRTEDALIKLFGKERVYVGHTFCHNVMTMAFYGAKPAPKSIVIETASGKPVKVATESRLDPKWLWFDINLRPTPIERELNDNRGLLDTLANQGDVASKTRQVDFTAYFKSRDRAVAFAAHVATKGYKLTHQGIWKAEDGSQVVGCEAALTTTLEPITMAKNCLYFRTQAAAYGGDFDGWACPVTK